ncbi:MAG: serine hydrolase [Gemmatimonadota bacterium]|nr:serine hydrolase [Gemmatimonadota bacterium]
MQLPSIRPAAVTAALALAACAQRTAPSPPPGGVSVHSTVSASGPAAAMLDPIISRIFALDLAPGMAVAVVRDTEVIYLKGFGYADLEARRPVTPETGFYIASTTKAFTALAAALLARDGTLDLDAPVSRYLPALRLAPPLAPDSITLRMLLSHTHGIGGDGPVVFRTAYSGDFTTEQLIALVAEHPPAPDGRNYRYGNIGYNVASLAMDAATGTPWKDVLERRIFEPLDMRGTSGYVSRIPAEQLAMPYAAEAEGYIRLQYAKGDESMHAAGGLVSTAADLARWLLANINDGQVDGQRVFPAEAMRDVHRQQASFRQASRGFTRFGYALGWNLTTYGSDTLLEHGGGFPGFATSIALLPARRIGVAVVVNENRLGGVLPDLVARYVYDKLAGRANVDSAMADTIASFARLAAQRRQAIGADRARRAARPQTLPHPLVAYAGAYENPAYGRMEWSVASERLEVRMGRMRSVAEVFDASKNQLRVELQPSVGEVITFQFEGGTAAALTYAERTYRRMGAP